MPRLNQFFACLIALALGLCLPVAAMAAPADGEAASGGGLLSFDIGSYIWKIIIFTVFLIVLSKFVWPPILGGLKAREAKQRSDLQTAEDAAKEAQKTLAEYKQQLAEAQKQAQRIIDESRLAAQQVAAQVASEAEARAKANLDRNAAEIRTAKEQAISEIYAQTAELSTQIAGKILGRQLNAADQQSLVNQSLQELGDLNRN